MMTSMPTRLWRKSSAAFAVLSLGLIKVACGTLPVDVLDRYVGFYYLNPGVATVTRDGQQLFIQVTGEAAREIRPNDETTFVYRERGRPRRIEFISDDQGPASALVRHINSVEVIAMRSDEATAEQINTNFIARVQANGPAPGTEAALRKFWDGVMSGEFNYSVMTTEGADVLKNITQQHPGFLRELRALGAIQALDWRRF